MQIVYLDCTSLILGEMSVNVMKEQCRFTIESRGHGCIELWVTSVRSKRVEMKVAIFKYLVSFCIFLKDLHWTLRSNRIDTSVQQSFSFPFFLGGRRVGERQGGGSGGSDVCLFFASEAGLTGHLVLEIFCSSLKRHELWPCQSSDVGPEDSVVAETC